MFDTVNKRAADNPVFIGEKVFDDNPFKDCYVFSFIRRGDERFHDGGPSPVTSGVDDAIAAVGRLPVRALTRHLRPDQKRLQNL